jgi:hypothetical protein
MFVGVTGTAGWLNTARRDSFARRAFSLSLALVWLVAAAAPVRYFFCKMSEGTHTSACCVDEFHALEEPAPGAQTSVEESQGSCCEPRQSTSLNVSSVSAPRFDPASFVQSLALLLPFVWTAPEQRHALRAQWPIRAGPSSARERHALLQVFLN